MAQFVVRAPGTARLVPGARIDGDTVQNLDSLVRLGIVQPVKRGRKKKGRTVNDESGTETESGV